MPTGSEGKAAPLRTLWRLQSDGLAWAGGVRPSIVRHCSSERMRSSGLGLAVLMTGLFAGVAATIVAGFLLHRPATSLWPVGLAWTVVWTNIERLLIMLSSTGRRLLLSFPLRLVLALPVGVLIAEVLLLQIFAPEENNIIGTTAGTQVIEQLNTVENFYQPQIATARAKIRAAQLALSALAAKVETNNFRSNCESSEQTCSKTGKLRCGVYCHHFHDVALLDQGALDRQRPFLQQQINTSDREAARLDSLRISAETRLRVRIAADTGLGAHKRALDQLQAHDAGIGFIVWLLRCIFVLLDLTPILLKSFFVLQGQSTYDQIVAAEQAHERLVAHKTRRRAWLETRKFDRELDWEDEMHESLIEDKRRRFFDETDWSDASRSEYPSSSHAPQRPRSPRAEPIPSMTLTAFTEASREHERIPVAIHRALRQLAWGSMTLLAALSVAVVALRLHGRSVAGWYLAPLALVALLAMAVVSRGFRRATHWAHRATYSTTLFGLSVAPLILGMNALPL